MTQSRPSRERPARRPLRQTRPSRPARAGDDGASEGFEILFVPDGSDS